MSNEPTIIADPSTMPKEGHGGDNTRGNTPKQGKEGNGAQKRQQKKKR